MEEEKKTYLVTVAATIYEEVEIDWADSLEEAMELAEIEMDHSTMGSGRSGEWEALHAEEI